MPQNSVQEGNFFYGFFSPQDGCHLAIDTNEIFSVGSENNFRDDPLRGQTFFLYPHQNFLLPAFLYGFRFSPTHGEQNKNKKQEKISLEYAPEVFYTRKKNSILIHTRDWHLQNAKLQIYAHKAGDDFLFTDFFADFTDENKIFSQKISAQGGEFTLPPNLEGIWENAAAKKFFLYVGLQQEYKDKIYFWLLEKNFSYAQNSLREEKKTSSQFFSYLSLKNILHPDGGIEKLIGDIETHNFVSTQPRKLGKLLEILRVATHNDEEKILRSLFIADRNFFLQVQQELFHDDLIPYLDSRELSNFLLSLPDETLQSLNQVAVEIKNYYRPLISKNRGQRIFSSTPEGEHSKKQKSEVWKYVEENFAKKYKKFFYAPGYEHKLFVPSAQRYNFSASPCHEQNTFLNSNFHLSVQHYHEQNLCIEIYMPAKELLICAEQEKNHFVLFYFKDISRGILHLRGLPRSPQRVIAAMLDEKGSLKENLALRIERK